MDPIQTKPLPRDVIGQFIGSPRGVRSYEALQGDAVNIYDAITQAQFLTLTGDPNLGHERIFTPAAGELDGTDGGVGGNYTLGLADTTVISGDYGDESHLVKITIDAKGRATAAEAFELNSDNVTEGGTNLFFTDARARAALSGGTGINYDNSTGVIATTGFSGTVSPVTSITVVNGIVTAAS